MSLGTAQSIALVGLDGRLVDVEAHLSNSLPGLIVSGLPDAACRQATERVRAAAASSDHPLPVKKIIINLSPASVPKAGTGFDLAMAVAIAAAEGAIAQEHCRRVVHLGELGLDGTVRAIPGVLPAVRSAVLAGVRHVVVPIANAVEARLVDGVTVHPVARLADLLMAYDVAGPPDRWPVPLPSPAPSSRGDRAIPDLADVAGQHAARAAIEVAAAGGHHVLLSGPPGSGKTMLAERLVGLLPRLAVDEALDVLAIASLRGEPPASAALDQVPPFVAPHHGASLAAMIGGGSSGIRPGAVSAAHNGVLFLDEAPEFKTDVLQALRQPLESGRVTIARARQTVTFPARFQLVLAANPCPCGNGFGKGLTCTCPPQRRVQYAAKLAGPLLDRVDVQVHVPPITSASVARSAGESTAAVGLRVAAAREAAGVRWGAAAEGSAGAAPWRRNADVPGRVLRAGHWRLPRSVTDELDRALERGLLTLRGYDRTLRLGWTQADLRGHTTPTAEDLGLALLLRNRGTEAAA